MNYSPRTWILVGIGVAVACMLAPHPVLAEIYCTAGLLVFAFGILVAIYSQGARRAFWVGFSILFGIYYSQTSSSVLQLLQFAPFGGRSSMMGAMGLITNHLLLWLYQGLHPTAFFNGSRNGMPPDQFGSFAAFLTMGHTLFAIGLGYAGGRFAQRLAAMNEARSFRSIEEILQDVDNEPSDH